jgi:hypothetical protein
MAILAFFERTLGRAQPPMDIEADAIIRALFVRNPDAAYRVTMAAMALQVVETPPERPRHKRWLSALFERRVAVQVRQEPVIS